MTNFGNITASYAAGTGLLTLSSSGATATLLQWQNALRAVSYTNSSDTPDTGTRTITFQANDGSALNNLSLLSTKQVSVAAANDSPIVTASGGTTAFTEGNNVTSTPVAVDASVTVTDVDSATLASATVQITGNLHSAEDVLAFTNTSGTNFGNITASYAAGTGLLTLSSSGATATLLQWQNALRAVSYTNSSDTPDTGTRTITIQANDGSALNSLSLLATKQVSVAAVNDAPVDHVPGPQSSVQNLPLVFSGSNAITITDVDANGGNETVTLAVTNGTLTLGSTPGTLSSVSGDGTATISLTGTLSDINAALDGLTYVGAVIGHDTLTVTANDNGNSGPLGPDVVASVDLAVQQPLTIDLDANDASANGNDYAALFTGSPVTIANPAVTPSSGLLITDHSVATIASATVTITGNFVQTEDVLTFVDTTNITGNYDTATGKLTLTGADTLAAYEAALQSVTYNDSAGPPNTANRTISVVVNDGTSNSNTATTTVYFHTLDLESTNPGTGSTATFTERALPTDPVPVVPIAGVNVSITDPDHGIARATITITNFQSSEDVLNFVNDGSTMGDVQISSDFGGVLVLTATTATLGEWEAALHAVTYGNTSDAPNTTDRDITVILNDGTFDTNAAHATIRVVATNDTPVAVDDTANTLGTPIVESNTQATTELIGSVSVLANDSDPDGAAETAALRVTAAGVSAGVQGAVDQAGSETSVVGTYGTLFIKADGTYRYVLDNTDPDTNVLAAGQTATESFVYTAANNGGGVGNEASATLTIHVQGTNDAPVAVADTAAVKEDTNTGGQPNPATGNVLSNDTDVDTTDTHTVTAVNGSGAGVNSDVAGTYGTLHLNANGSYTYTLDNTNPAVQALAEGQTIADAFSYTNSDGNGGSSTASLTVTVTGTNDAPVAVADTAAVKEDTNTGGQPNPATGNVLSNDTDVDTADTHTVRR